MEKQQQKKQQQRYYSTVMQSRFPIFLPLIRTKREKYNLEIENKYGRFKITAPFKLTQQHRNALDGLFCVYEKRAIMPDGTVDLLFSPTKLKKFLNKHLGKKYETRYWIEKLKELRHATIILEWRRNNKTKVISEMAIVERVEIEEIVDKETTAKLKRLGIDTKVKKMYVRLSPNYIRLVREDIIMYAYSQRKLKEFVAKIYDLRDPLLQSFARFCITHQSFQFKLDDILQIIDPAWQNLNKIKKSQKRKIITSNFSRLKFLGDIQLKNNIIVYSNSQNTLFFKDPYKDKVTPNSHQE